MSDDPSANDPRAVQAPSPSAGGEAPGPGASNDAGSETPKTPLGKRLLRWFLVFLALVILGVVTYRWAGTSTAQGTVQRVYEEGASHRVEFVDASGEVLVLINEPMSFPHFKPDTSDLQAELHRYSETGDIVRITTWGFRASWFSVYPNAIDVDFVQSNKIRKKQHIDHLTQTVIDELIDQGVVERGEDSERMRPGLTEALQKSMNQSRPTQREESPAE